MHSKPGKTEYGFDLIPSNKTSSLDEKIYFLHTVFKDLLDSEHPSATTRPRVAVPGETNLSTQVIPPTQQ